MPFFFLSTPFFYHLSELLQSGQRRQWWWRRRRGRGRRLRDPPHHTSKPRRPFSAPSHRSWVRLPLPLPASQWFAQLLLLPRAASSHDVQHAGSGRSPPLWAYALCKYSFFFCLFLALGLYASQNIMLQQAIRHCSHWKSANNLAKFMSKDFTWKDRDLIGL